MFILTIMLLKTKKKKILPLLQCKLNVLVSLLTIMSLSPQIKNDDGWITLDTMLKFKRLASISSDKAVIAAALRNSTPSFIEVFIIDM